MRTKLRRLGNSQGVIVPKPYLDELGLVDDVDLIVENDRLVITKARRPRDGWEIGSMLDVTQDEGAWLEADLETPAPATTPATSVPPWDGTW